MQTLYENDAGCLRAYYEEFPGYHSLGDAGTVDADGYLSVMARTDDVINVAGHRLSTGAFEEVLLSHEAVAECAVVGATDELKGQVPVGLIVLTSGAAASPGEVEEAVVRSVREQIGPVAAFRDVAVVQALPKTRSGKTLRGILQKIADGADYKLPGTIEDEAPVAACTEALGTLGYPQKSSSSRQ